MNPFEARGDPRAWLSWWCSVLRGCYFLRDGATSLLRDVVWDLYSVRGCLAGSDNWPSVHDVCKEVRSRKFARTARTQGWLESLMRVLNALLDRFGNLFSCRRGMDPSVWARESVVFDVSGMQDTFDLECLVCLILEQSGNHVSVCATYWYTPVFADTCSRRLRRSHECQSNRESSRIHEPHLLVLIIDR